MKADFDGPHDGGDRPPSTDGWLRLVVLIVAVLVVVSAAILLFPRG
jgi:hypothetical protein